MPEIRMNPGWEEQVLRALLPEMRDLADSIQERINANAPVETGSLRAASFAEVDETTSEVLVGVHSDVPNPTGGKVGDYSHPVIDGHFTQNESGYVPANQYLALSVDEALQERRIQ